nr:bifunctional 3'-5' exonuclease/DNA polymerase [Nakamurella flavida]
MWDATDAVYPSALAAGARIPRVHDITLTERLLLGREGRHGEPLSAAAVLARLAGSPVPADPPPVVPEGHPELFAAVPRRSGTTDPTGLGRVWADQVRRIGDDNALRLLVAAESAGALAAVEMTRAGLPWDAAVHGRLLTDALGARPPTGRRPPRMRELAERIDAAFGFPVNPDSAVDLRGAFQRVGHDVESTRAWVLQSVDHPAVPDVLAYKELARLHTANGWAWLDEWVQQGRFHPGYVPAGVVSGRWAARGGGVLQIPRLLRTAVRADPGHLLVVADAAQLEPRVLAAVSGDEALQRASAAEDLYGVVAREGFGGDRNSAKTAVLGAMYGATAGEAGRLVPVLYRQYPQAMGCVQAAAEAGERGRTVRSVLGRQAPAPSAAWSEAVLAGSVPEAGEAAARRARQVARERGRFTRNFLVQASAADWAAVWLSGVRRDLAGLPGAELVLFQHDELVVHCPAEHAPAVGEVLRQAAEDARALVFPGSAVRTPVDPVAVGCYADAK